MRASASGELVKDEVGQVPLRRCSRAWGPGWGSVASEWPSTRLLAASIGVVAALVAGQPQVGAAQPGPDPHPSATQPTGTPTPDPAPGSRRSAPTPDSTAAVASGSSSAYEPAAERSSPPTTVEQPRAAKPAPRPRPTAKPKARVKEQAAAATAPTPTPRGGSGKESVRVAAKPSAAVSVAKSATDPMVLGAFALLTLALSSAGMLLVLHHSERSGARA
jgi:cytoskeletal protein RodZ